MCYYPCKIVTTIGDEDGGSSFWPNSKIRRLKGRMDSILGAFSIYCNANEIANEGKKRAVFLASVASATLKLLSNLTAPEKPKEKSLKDINDLLKKHYNPAPFGNSSEVQISHPLQKA